MESILEFAKTLIKSHTCPTDIVVDATVGNGFDTRFLAELVPNGLVYGFDIQKEAIRNTSKLLNERDIKNVILFENSHEFVDVCIPKSYHGHIASAIFNLGYLPKGNKAITTKAHSTVKALGKLLPLIKKHGLIVLVIYSGHPGGKEEMDAIIEYVKVLNQKEVEVLNYQFLNQINAAPFLIALEKLV